MPIYIKCPYRGCRVRNSRRNITENDNRCRKCGRKIPVHSREYVGEIVVDGRRRMVPLGTGSLQNAEERLAIIQGSAKRGELSTPAEGIVTWLTVRLAYTRKLESEGASPRYQIDGNRYLRQMGAYWGDSIPVTAITPSMIREFRVTLLDRGLSKTTADRYLASAKAAWRHAVDDVPSPFDKVKLFRENNQVTQFLTPDERTRLLKAAKQISKHLYEIIAIALATGLRKNDVLRLRRNSVDFQNDLIRIVQEKGKRPLTLPLSPEARQILEQVPDNDTPFFWVSAKTGEPYHHDWRKTWEKAKKMAGIDPAFTFHGLRHTRGTVIYNATRDLRMTKELLGHSQQRTTERYAHVLPDYLREAAAVPTLGNLTEDEESQGVPAKG